LQINFWCFVIRSLIFNSITCFIPRYFFNNLFVTFHHMWISELVAPGSNATLHHFAATASLIRWEVDCVVLLVQSCLKFSCQTANGFIVAIYVCWFYRHSHHVQFISQRLDLVHTSSLRNRLTAKRARLNSRLAFAVPIYDCIVHEYKQPDVRPPRQQVSCMICVTEH